MTMQILTPSEELILVTSGVAFTSVKVFFIVMSEDEVTSTDDPLVVTLTYADAYDGTVEEEVSLPFIKTIDNNHYYSAPWKNIVKISTGEEPPAEEDFLWDDTEEWDDTEVWNEELEPLDATAPKIFQGTESSFVVIESPFEPAPQGGHSSSGYGGYSWDSLNYHVGLTSTTFRYPGDATSYFIRVRSNKYRAIYSTIRINLKVSPQVYWNEYLINPPKWYNDAGNLHLIIQTLSIGAANSAYIGNGEWVAEPHTDPTKGFLFWSAYNSSNQKILSSNIALQKSMLFKEGQTVIDTSDFWYPATAEVSENTNGFKAIIVPWTDDLDTRLKRRWLLSDNGKLLKYYATECSADWCSGTTGDFELSTPTTLT